MWASNIAMLCKLQRTIWTPMLDVPAQLLRPSPAGWLLFDRCAFRSISVPMRYNETSLIGRRTVQWWHFVRQQWLDFKRRLSNGNNLQNWVGVQAFPDMAYRIFIYKPNVAELITIHIWLSVIKKGFRSGTCMSKPCIHLSCEGSFVL
jgi:hypothetical protein